MANVGGPNRPQLHQTDRQGFIDAANEAPQGGHVKVAGGQVRAGTLVGMKGQAWNWLVAMPGPIGAQTRDRNRQAIEAFVGALVQAGYTRAAVEGELGRHLPGLDGRHRLSREALLDTTRALPRLAPNAGGGPPAAPGAGGIAPATGAAQQIAAPVPAVGRAESDVTGYIVYHSDHRARAQEEDDDSDVTGYLVHQDDRTREQAPGPIPTIVGGGYTPPDEDGSDVGDPDVDSPGADPTRA